MDGPIRMDCLPPHRAAVTSRNWPKATINVAWGNAPGNRSHSTRLAEGQTHLRHGLPCVNMAFGQTPRCAPIPGALPQATVRTDLRPDDSYPGTAPLVQGRQPDTGFAVRSKPLMRSGSPVEQMSKPAPGPNGTVGSKWCALRPLYRESQREVALCMVATVAAGCDLSGARQRGRFFSFVTVVYG